MPERKVSAQVVGPAALSLSRQVFSSALDGQQLLARARQRAEAVLAELEAQRAEALAEARQAGYQEGLAQAAEVLVRARAEARQLRKTAEQRLVRLAVRIAERILDAQLRLEPEYVVSVARKTMEQVSWCRKLVFRVHPEDLAFLERHRQSLLAQAGEADVEFVADGEVCRGGCILETEVGRIDATLDSQLRAVEQALTTSHAGEEEIQ